MSESTAVATQDEQTDVSPELAAAREELARLRAGGLALVARQKALNTVTKMLHGVTWGDVRGSNLSEATRYSIARVCELYGADPVLHLDILGGRVYRNAQYWTEKLNGLPNLVDWYQVNISKSYSEEMRELAKRTFNEATEFEDEDAKDHARQMLAQARQADERRAFFGIPDEAVAAYETIVELADRDTPVREANYAPHKKDPVGSERPHETARTRSLRRAAVKASPDLRQLEEKAKLEGVIEAEFQIVREDMAADQLPQDGPQAVLGSGEPEAASTNGAQPLPVEGESDDARGGNATPAGSPSPEEVEDEEEFDRNDARKRLFATLTEAGIDEKRRKAWAKENDLPASTKNWSPADFDRAVDILIAPVRDRVTRACEAAGVDLGQLSQGVLGQDTPQYLKHWKLLESSLEARGIEPVADEPDEPAEAPKRAGSL